MIRVLHIINRLNLGGPTSQVASLAHYLNPEFETRLVAGMIDATEGSSQYIVDDLGLIPEYIPEMFRAINLRKDLAAFRRLTRIIRDFNPQIVHTHAAKAGALGRMAAHHCGVPVILHTFHGHVFHSYFPAWKTSLFIRTERFLARRSSRIIAISEAQKYELGTVFRICPPEKIVVIPLGIDFNRFGVNREIKRAEWRRQHLVEDDEIVVSIVGRLVPVKNHRLFLTVIRRIAEKRPGKIRAFIVGDGEEMQSLHSQANEMGLDWVDFFRSPAKATVTFTSWIRQVDAVYAGSDVVALTSLNEGTPVSILEAMAAGKPVVTTAVGGIPDFFREPDDGLIVPPNNTETFARALLQLMDDRNLRQRIMDQDRTEHLQRFGTIRMIQDMKLLYWSLLPS